MSYPAFNPQPLKAQAQSILKEAIINGDLTEEVPITERLALEKYQISKTPFREAIQSLEAQGWVKKIPYKGTYVVPLTAKDIEDIFELRLLLEPPLVDPERSKINEKQMKQLAEITKQMKNGGSLQSDKEFMLLDQDFHRVLYESSENLRLLQIFEEINDSIRRIGMQVLHYQSRRDELIREHEQILTGLKEGTAVEALQTHLLNQQQAFMDRFNKQNED